MSGRRRAIGGMGDACADAVLWHYGCCTAGPFPHYVWANVDNLSEFAAGWFPSVLIELSVFSIE